MSIQDEHLKAEFIDKFLQRVAIGVVLVALAFNLSALAFVVPDAVAFYLNKIELALGILAVIIVLPQFIKMMRCRMRGEAWAEDADSFVANIYRRAAEKGFSLTFVALVVLIFLSDDYLIELPLEFYFQALLAFSLGVFSLTFFWLLWADEEAPADEFDSGSSQ